MCNRALYTYVNVRTFRAGIVLSVWRLTVVWTAGDRKPAGAIFSTPVQTSPGPRLASYTVGTGSLFPVVARQGCGGNHPPPSTAEVKERVELYLCSPSGPTCRVLLSAVPYTCMHPHWQQLHPLCSWSGYGPAVIFHPQPKLPKSRIRVT
jgi:hypothetical protein